MTDDDIRGLLGELRDEPVPADSLARVRLAVAGRSTRKRWFGAPWKTLAALASAAAVLFILVWIRPAQHPVVSTPVVQREVATVQAPAPPAITPAPAKVRAVVERKPKNTIRRKTQVSAGEGVLVRIETEDPDVVILLIGN